MLPPGASMACHPSSPLPPQLRVISTAKEIALLQLAASTVMRTAGRVGQQRATGSALTHSATLRSSAAPLLSTACLHSAAQAPQALEGTQGESQAQVGSSPQKLTKTGTYRYERRSSSAHAKPHTHGRAKVAGTWSTAALIRSMPPQVASRAR